MFKKLAALAATVAAFFSVQTPALAAVAGGPDFSTLTGAIDVTTTGEAILAVAAVMIGLALIMLGVRKVYRMIK